MPNDEYALITEWRVHGTVDEVADVFRDLDAFVRWWPAVFLDDTILEKGDANGLGRTGVARTKGWMPHTMRFWYRVVDVRHPSGFTLCVRGDFDGTLTCRSYAVGSQVALYFDWRVRVRKPFVRRLSRLLRPLFIGNHLWVSARGEESLDIELEKRRMARCGAGVARMPPRPTFPHGPLTSYWKSRVTSRARLLRRVPDMALGNIEPGAETLGG